MTAVGHQNLPPHNSLFSFGFVMENNAPLLAPYEKYGVLCNPSGHMHVQHTAQSEGGLPEIATLPLMVFPNQYGTLALDGTTAEYNTPAIIKYPSWRMTAQNPKAVYACINYGEVVCPKEIRKQSICIDADIGGVLRKLCE